MQRSRWNRCTLGLKSISPTATQATLTIGSPACLALVADELALPDVDVERVGEDVDGVEADLLGLPDAVGRRPPGLHPRGVDQAELHVLLYVRSLRGSLIHSSRAPPVGALLFQFAPKMSILPSRLTSTSTMLCEPRVEMTCFVQPWPPPWLR